MKGYISADLLILFVRLQTSEYVVKLHQRQSVQNRYIDTPEVETARRLAVQIYEIIKHPHLPDTTRLPGTIDFQTIRIRLSF